MLFKAFVMSLEMTPVSGSSGGADASACATVSMPPGVPTPTCSGANRAPMPRPLVRSAQTPAKRYHVSLIVVGSTPPPGFSSPIKRPSCREASRGSSPDRMRLMSSRVMSRAASDDWQAAQIISVQPDGPAAAPRWWADPVPTTSCSCSRLSCSQLQRQLRGLKRRSWRSKRLSCMQASTHPRIPRIRRLDVLKRPRCPVDRAFLMQTTQVQELLLKQIMRWPARR